MVFLREQFEVDGFALDRPGIPAVVLQWETLQAIEKISLGKDRYSRCVFCHTTEWMLSALFRSHFMKWDTLSRFLRVSFNIPIFSSGNRRAGVSQKRIAYEQAKNSKEFAAEGLRVEFMQYKYDFANALEKYRSDKKNLELSEKVVRVTKTKYTEGLTSSLELSQVNNQYIQALTNYTGSMVELLNAKIKIDKLINEI